MLSSKVSAAAMAITEPAFVCPHISFPFVPSDSQTASIFAGCPCAEAVGSQVIYNISRGDGHFLRLWQ